MNPPTIIFCKVEKKLITKIIFIFYPPTLNIICYLGKNNIFLRFCLCIFESDTVKSDCPVQMIKYLKIQYRLLVYLTSFTVFSGDTKKNL